MFVYVIVCGETLKIYIGQHKGKNLQKYLQTKFSDAKHGRGGSSHLYHAMRKHSGATWSIHPLVSGLQTRAECDAWERYYISHLKTQHPDVGYNIQCGGEGASPNNQYAQGCKHSSEAIRRTLGGKNFSAEWRQHQSEAHKGQVTWNVGVRYSTTHRANLSKSHKGVPWSAARRAAQENRSTK